MESEQLMQTENNTQTEPVFTVGRRDVILAAASYLMGYFYLERLWSVGENSPWYIFCHIFFLILMIGAAELWFRHVPRTKESWIWLGCLLLSSAGVILEREGVWEYWQQIFFQEAFYVWWFLSRSGRLLEERSGSFLAADAFNGFVRIPFGHIGLRVRTFYTAVRQRSEKGVGEKKNVLFILLAAGCSVLLFSLAFCFLADADTNFYQWTSRLFSFEGMIDLHDFFIDLIFSIPVGAWLHGLIAGAGRTSRSKLENEKQGLQRFLESIKKVPAAFWLVAIGLFTVLYLAFFAFQASYLFGAFQGKLPEGFLVAEYARQGFFELCKVTCINFALLWLAKSMNCSQGKGMWTVRFASVVMLVENMIFCAIALSKLILYIDTFGFTPKRLESTWLVCVILAGCLAWLYQLLREKSAFRAWMIFGAVSLSILCLL